MFRRAEVQESKLANMCMPMEHRCARYKVETKRTILYIYTYRWVWLKLYLLRHVYVRDMDLYDHDSMTESISFGLKSTRFI